MRLRPKSREARHKARAGSAESPSATAQAATHEWSPPEHWRRHKIYAVRGVRLQKRGAARVWQQSGGRSTDWQLTSLLRGFSRRLHLLCLSIDSVQDVDDTADRHPRGIPVRAQHPGQGRPPKPGFSRKLLLCDPAVLDRELGSQDFFFDGVHGRALPRRSVGWLAPKKVPLVLNRLTRILCDERNWHLRTTINRWM